MSPKTYRWPASPCTCQSPQLYDRPRVNGATGNDMTNATSRGLLLASSLVLLFGCGDDGGTDDSASTSPSTGSDTDDTGDTDDTTSGGSTSDGSDSEGLEEPDIAGSYVENFPGGMATHVISSGSWMTDYGMGPDGYDLVQVDNDNLFVVGESTSAAGTFAKLQWTFVEDDLYYCTVVFDATSAEDAAAAAPADDSDPANGGCSMFSWSLLEPS